MTEQQRARSRGFTQLIFADNGIDTLDLLIRPDTDLDGHYNAFDLDNDLMIVVHGWLFTHEFA